MSIPTLPTAAFEPLLDAPVSAGVFLDFDGTLSEIVDEPDDAVPLPGVAEALSELRSLGVTDVPAQGLPGVLGRDGWLASSAATRGTFLCRLPGVTTAVRLDIHFWWNTGETALMILAANAYCRDVLGLTGEHSGRAATAREAGRR